MTTNTALAMDNPHSRSKIDALGQRKLTRRRGSRSAPDPWSLTPLQTPQHEAVAISPGGELPPAALASSPSSSASRITIVRLLEDGKDSGNGSAGSAFNEQDFGVAASSPVGRSRSWGAHSRNSSSGSTTPSTNGPASPPASRSHSPGLSGGRRPGTRLSFAFNSFTPINPAPNASPTIERGPPNFVTGVKRPASPGYNTSIPAINDSSSIANRRRSHSNPTLDAMSNKRADLTADQIFDIAISSTRSINDVREQGDAVRPSTAPGSPVIQRPKSRPTTPGLIERREEQIVQPAVFRPMPEEVLLPFLNRPAEVTALLTEYPTKRLFALLEALFPLDMRGHGTHTTQDPKRWHFGSLEEHLKDRTRAEASDKVWVKFARSCIRSRSEALWERFKDALGVPSELEVEIDEEDDLTSSDEDEQGPADGENPSPNTTTNESGGLQLKEVRWAENDVVSFAPPALEEPGRDAVLEPVFAEPMVIDEQQDAGSSMDPSDESLSDTEWHSSNRVMENIGEADEDEEEGPEEEGMHMSNSTSSLIDKSSGRGSVGYVEDDYGLGPSASSQNLLPSTREIKALQITTSAVPSTPSTMHDDLRLNLSASPQHVALGISGSGGPQNSPTSSYSYNPYFGNLGSAGVTSTSSLATPTSFGGGLSPGSNSSQGGLPASLSPRVSPLAFLAKPLNDIRADDNQDGDEGSGAATPVPIPKVNVSSASPSPRSSPMKGPSALRRPSESLGDVAARLHDDSQSARGSYQGFGGVGLSTYPDRGYHPVFSERGPGNPLFPSSFAGLSVGPTLVANARRASKSGSDRIAIPSGTHYPVSLLRQKIASMEPSSPTSTRPRPFTSTPSATGRRAWANVRDKYEYAVTLASASSDGGR